MERTCTICGAQFQGASHSKFCSPKCKKEGERARRAAKAESEARAPLPAQRCECGGPGVADEDGHCAYCGKLKPEPPARKAAARAALAGFIDSHNQQAKELRESHAREVAQADQLAKEREAKETWRGEALRLRRYCKAAEAKAREGVFGGDAERMADLLAERLGDPEQVADLVADRMADRLGEREEFNVERQFLTTAEKAAQLGVSADTVRRNYKRYGGWKDGEVGEGKKPRLRFPVESGNPEPVKPKPESKPKRPKRRPMVLEVKGESPFD